MPPVEAPAQPPAPQQLAPHYSRFGVSDRLALTGHSHQAWPDVAFEAQQRAWADAAELWDDKWERAEAQAERVRAGYAHFLGDNDHGRITLADSTHTLLVRLLSGWDWSERPRIVTTDAEFHSARRQLDRLEESIIDVVRVPSEPVETLAERMSTEVDDETGVVLVSKVLFRTGRVVPALGVLAQACRRSGALFVVDSYHAVGALDWTLADDDLHDAYVLGGGYKYMQQGEGCCFMRWPADTQVRPHITGWYAEFGSLQSAPAGEVAFGNGPERFAGGTYDPTSHYRGARVLDFFAEHGLDRVTLRAVSLRQVARLSDGFDALDLDPSLVRRELSGAPEQRAGFLALASPRAGDLRRRLHERGVFTDHRGDTLRLGPAPYLRDDQLDAAVAALGEVIRSL